VQEKNERQMELERQFEKIYANAGLCPHFPHLLPLDKFIFGFVLDFSDLRENLPQPIDIDHKNSLNSTLDSDLDLTLIENKEHDILNEYDMNKQKDNQQQQQLVLIAENPQRIAPDEKDNEQQTKNRNQGTCICPCASHLTGLTYN
jgi:hypothetical protein